MKDYKIDVCLVFAITKGIEMKRQIFLAGVVGIGVMGTLIVAQEAIKKPRIEGPVKSEQINLKAADVKSNAPTLSNILSQGDKVDLTIRFVDSFDAMRACHAGKEAQKSLEKTRGVLTKDIQKEEQKIALSVKEFQSKSTTISDMAREKEEKVLRKMEVDYKSKVQESEYEMKLAMQKSTEELTQDLEEAVKVVAERDKLDAVVDTMTGRVLYASNKVNVTNNIISQMDTGRKLQLTQNKNVSKDKDTVTVAAKKAESAKASA